MAPIVVAPTPNPRRTLSMALCRESISTTTFTDRLLDANAASISVRIAFGLRGRTQGRRARSASVAEGGNGIDGGCMSTMASVRISSPVKAPSGRVAEIDSSILPLARRSSRTRLPSSRICRRISGCCVHTLPISGSPKRASMVGGIPTMTVPDNGRTSRCTASRRSSNCRRMACARAYRMRPAAVGFTPDTDRSSSFTFRSFSRMASC